MSATMTRDEAQALAERIQRGDADEWIADLQRILASREKGRLAESGVRVGATVRFRGEQTGELAGLTATVIRVSKKTVTVRVHVGQDPHGLSAEEITRTIREARAEWEESGRPGRPFLAQIPFPHEYRVSPGLVEAVETTDEIPGLRLATTLAHEWWTEGGED